MRRVAGPSGRASPVAVRAGGAVETPIVLGSQVAPAVLVPWPPLLPPPQPPPPLFSPGHAWSERRGP